MKLVGLNRKKVFLIIVRYGGKWPIFVLLAIIMVGCNLSQSNLAACENAYIPVVSEFGPGYVTLSNGARLALGDSYSFHGGMEARFYTMQLLESNHEGAKLKYKIESDIPGEVGAVDPYSTLYGCIQNIDVDGPAHQLYPKAYMIQACDFGNDWHIERYTEVVNPVKTNIYQPNPISQRIAFLEAEHIKTDGDKRLPYEIYIEINHFDTEEDATNAYSEWAWGDDIFASPGFRSEFVNYAEYCRRGGGTDFCRYLGQHDRYIAEIVMSFLFEFDNSDLASKQKVDPEEWQYVVDLVEGKLLEE